MRKISKDEFVERMIADQNIRREKRNKERHAVIYGYVAARAYRLDHRNGLRKKRSGGVKNV